MFTKDRLLRIAKVSESLFDYAMATGLIPAPSKILWLNPPPERDIFPEYVLTDLIHLGHLESFGFSAPWELKKFLFGAEGIIKYETDLKKICGDVFYHEVKCNNRRGLGEELCQRVGKFFPSQRIVGTTFRNEGVNGKDFIILSRAVLRPKTGLLGVELSRRSSKDYQRRLTAAYGVITKGAPL